MLVLIPNWIDEEPIQLPRSPSFEKVNASRFPTALLSDTKNVDTPAPLYVDDFIKSLRSSTGSVVVCALFNVMLLFINEHNASGSYVPAGIVKLCVNSWGVKWESSAVAGETDGVIVYFGTPTPDMVDVIAELEYWSKVMSLGDVFDETAMFI